MAGPKAIEASRTADLRYFMPVTFWSDARMRFNVDWLKTFGDRVAGHAIDTSMNVRWARYLPIPLPPDNRQARKDHH